jgi:flagellar capping protein FliD
MKLVLDYLTPSKLRVNGTRLPSDLLVKELVSSEMHEELISLLAKEKEIITTRQSLLDKIRTNFNTNIANFNTDLVSIENLLRQKYPEAFL